MVGLVLICVSFVKYITPELKQVAPQPHGLPLPSLGSNHVGGYCIAPWERASWSRAASWRARSITVANSGALGRCWLPLLALPVHGGRRPHVDR
jgi:hypothetical protein